MSARLLPLAAALFLLVGAPALAASVSGTVRNEQNAPLQNMQVRLWAASSKGLTAAHSVTTDAQGAFTFTQIPAGTYKLNARMSAGASGNYGDRWYDVAPPVADGYVSADADEIVLGELDVATGYELTLQVLGGFDGTVHANGQPAVDALIRGERAGVPAIHHTDLSRAAPHAGRFFLRGMVPETDYRFIVHDPNGQWETFVSEGHTVATNANTQLPTFNLQPAPSDPNEPNDGPLTAVEVDTSLFAQMPPQPWQRNDARIAPRNAGDVDWYCLNANAGERFIIEARSRLTTSTGPRDNPFVDPLVGFFEANTGAKLAEDDDSGPGLGAQLDTGVLQAGRYCVAVTTFGDAQFVGQNQGSAGAYGVTIHMGNRRPVISGTVAAAPLPQPPQAFELEEGQSVTFDFTWSDPDMDVLMASAQLVDNVGAPVTGAQFTPGAGGGSWSWSADQIAAQKSPYELRVQVQDAEFTESVTVVIAVDEVNLPPSTPLHDSPESGTVVTTATPTFTALNSTDPDGDVLQYQFEVYYGDATDPAQTQLVMEGAGGSTSFTPSALPENTIVRWRVRAYDGHADAPYSPWSMPWTVFVDVQNDPPSAPQLVKPAEAEVVMGRKPALSVTNPTDPEGDMVSIVFQVASDVAFTQGLVESAPVPVAGRSTSTGWSVPNDLPWGSQWYARARAVDSRGRQSPFGNGNRFRIKPNAPPSVPAFGAPFDVQCQGRVAAESVPVVMVGPSNDPEHESVQLQLVVLPWSDGGDVGTPLFEHTLDQPVIEPVSFDVSGITFAEDSRYRFRARAFDGTDYSDWSECDLTWNLQSGGGENPGGNPGDGDGSSKTGCDCSSGGGSLALWGVALLAVLMGRRRQLMRMQAVRVDAAR